MRYIIHRAQQHLLTLDYNGSTIEACSLLEFAVTPETAYEDIATANQAAEKLNAVSHHHFCAVPYMPTFSGSAIVFSMIPYMAYYERGRMTNGKKDWLATPKLLIVYDIYTTLVHCSEIKHE